MPFHPGLGNFVSIEDLRWAFGSWYSVQTCGVKKGLSRPGTPVYKTRNGMRCCCAKTRVRNPALIARLSDAPVKRLQPARFNQDDCDQNQPIRQLRDAGALAGAVYPG